MRARTRTFLFLSLVLFLNCDESLGFTCETTLAANDPNTGYSDQVSLADCKIVTQESSRFIIQSGDNAVFTAEQYIRLRPGFHAQKGSSFHADFRECIRNPDENTGYASWGSYDEAAPEHAGEQWMKRVAERFVENFNSPLLAPPPPLTVSLKHDFESSDIPDFFRDRTLTNDGRDDSEDGIDKGVFLFHVAHGQPERFNVRDGDTDEYLSHRGPANIIVDDELDQEMLLGNCSSDGRERGELRYLWLCSCQVLAHGPSIDGYWEFDQSVESIDEVTGTELQEGNYLWHPTNPQYDRPSEFDGSPDSESHRNAIARWGGVLSENMRMVCGLSTSGTCSGNRDNHRTADNLKRNYFGRGMSVADSWGHAFEQYWRSRVVLNKDKEIQRAFRITPVCIAKGNMHTHNLKSPITEDQRFTNKANPYTEAFHLVSWEWESLYPRLVHKKQPPPDDKLPVLLTAWPGWATQEKYFEKHMAQEGSYREGDMLIAKKATLDGRPAVKIHTRTGAVTIAGKRTPLHTNKETLAMATEEYASAARAFIEAQGWDENDLDTMEAVRGMLQVIPANSDRSSSEIIKLQKDITFYVGRRIALGSLSPKVFGSDNQIVVQMNNDGTIKSASKSWRKITAKIEGIPVKSYEEAYAEAMNQMGKPGMYKLSTWDWGYKSTTDESGQDMMVVYYFFNFDPIGAVDECISQPMLIEIQGHIL